MSKNNNNVLITVIICVTVVIVAGIFAYMSVSKPAQKTKVVKVVQKEQTETAKEEPKPEEKKQEEPKKQESPKNDMGSALAALQGTIRTSGLLQNTWPQQLVLNISGTKVSGSYLYEEDGVQKSNNCSGTARDMGSYVQLHVTAYQGGKAARIFDGQVRNGVFSGTMTSGFNGSKRPFRHDVY